MKKTLLLFIAVFSFLGIFAQVTLPHYDGIDYTAGQALQTQTSWTSINSGDDLVIESGSLTYSGLQSSTGNRVKFDGGGIDAAKSFTSQTSGTVYYSFLLKVTDLGSLNSTTGGYFSGFTDNTTGFASVIWLRANGTDFNIGISPRSNQAATWETTNYTVGTTYLIVIAHEIVSDASNDISKLWVNPTIGSNEPAVTLSVTNGATDLASVQRILIRQDNASNTPFIEMDEIRVGTTWASVTPTGVATPQLSVNPTSIVDFLYNVGSGPSGVKSFIITGTNLTNNVGVVLPTNYDLSLSNSPFTTETNPLDIVPVSGGVNQTVYARLKSGLDEGTYNETLNITSTGATTVTVAFEGVVVSPTPSLTVTPQSLTGFSTEAGTASSVQTYTVTGYNLTENVTITAPTGFEVSSTSATTGFGPTATISYGSGSISNIVVWVRIAATASVGEVSGNVTNGSTGLSQNVSVQGNVTAPIPSITVNPSSLSGFTTISGNPSTAQTYTVSGNNLIEDILITAPTGYEVSITSATVGFAPTASVSYGTGTVATTTVWVRIASTASVGEVSGNVTNISSGVTQNVAVTGNVTVEQIANLPIDFSGPWKNTTEPGWTQNGLDNDYSTGQAKFASTGCWLKVHFDGQAYQLKNKLRGNTSSVSWDGTFNIEESANGTDWTVVYSYSGAGALPKDVYTEFVYDLDPSTRYVRWIFVNKISGSNVGLEQVIITNEAPIEDVTIYDIQYTEEPGGDSPLLGQTVRTRGIVTVLHSDGFIMQDGIESWNGISVYNLAKDVAVGDSVAVTAVVSEIDGLTILGSEGSILINTLATGKPLPLPINILTGTVALEQYESMLVRVENATCIGYQLGNWLIDDGTGAIYGFDLFFDYDAIEGHLYNINCYILEDEYGYYFAPRSLADIDDITSTPSIKTDAKISVYPNPAQNFININGNGISSIRLVNVMGQVLQTISNPSENVIQLNISNLQNGIYFIDVNIDNKVVSTKFVKE